MSTAKKPAKEHLWASKVAPEKRRQQRIKILLKKIQEFLNSEKAKLLALALIYAILFITIAFSGLGPLVGFALLPLILIPALAYLAYWLIWQEFH